jgi:hypothetical protein
MDSRLSAPGAVRLRLRIRPVHIVGDRIDGLTDRPQLLRSRRRVVADLVHSAVARHTSDIQRPPRDSAAVLDLQRQVRRLLDGVRQPREILIVEFPGFGGQTLASGSSRRSDAKVQAPDPWELQTWLRLALEDVDAGPWRSHVARLVQGAGRQTIGAFPGRD